MANTFTLIEAQTLSSSVASVTLGSGGTIPQTYTDLKIVTSLRSTTGSAVTYSTYMKVNNLTTSIYSQKALEGNGSAASSFSQSGVNDAVRASTLSGTGATASTFTNSEIYIPNYTSANYKSASIDTVSETNATTVYSNLIAYLVSTNDAITSLTFTPESAAGNFAQGSTFYLYGIKKS